MAAEFLKVLNFKDKGENVDVKLAKLNIDNKDEVKAEWKHNCVTIICPYAELTWVQTRGWPLTFFYLKIGKSQISPSIWNSTKHLDR